ncbi:MAG: MBL fold metallo-hydrolase [Pseudomonadota bacterium]
MLVFRQQMDPESSTYTYLLADADTREAILIDPVVSQVTRDRALLRELGLKLVATLETHVHADHITGGAALRDACGSEVMLAATSGAAGADRYLDHGERISFGGRSLEVRATPGHTGGCVSFVLDDQSKVFTGDALLIRGCGRTDFQEGSAARLYHSVREQIFTLPDDCLIYPGHDYRGLTVSSVAEEKHHNPRLGGQIQVDDFVGFMANLGLAHPKQMDVAVPANLRCGAPSNTDDEEPIDPSRDWAPLICTFAGIWEIQPQWVRENGDAVQLVDVRGPDEFNGELSHIVGASLIPLEQLVDRSAELQPDRPIVTVCRTGARSAQATVLLRKAGFTKLANLSGGMRAWHDMGFAVA